LIVSSNHTNKNLLSLVWLLLAISVLACACESATAAEVNVSKSQLPLSLGLYLDHMEDISGELGIEDVQQLKSQWRRSTQAIPTLGFSSSAHWFSITISGQELAGMELVMSIEAPTIDRIEFYLQQDEQPVERVLAGDTIPLSQQVARYRIPLFPFKVNQAATETQIYIRVSSQSGIELPIYLTTMQQIVEAEQNELAFFGGFFSFFSVCFAACWVIYYFQRDRQFLGYTVFFGSSIIFFLTLTGMGKVWLWGETIEMNNRLSYASGAILVGSFCLLGQSLNLTGKMRDRVVIVLRFIAYTMIPTSLYFLLLPFDFISGGNIESLLSLGLLVCLVVFIMASIAAAQGSRAATYLVATWGLLILAYLSFLGYKFNILEKSTFSAIVGETLVAFSGIALLLSLAEFVKSKNEAFTLVNLETKAKSAFLSNVSKEFLTPVHLILANSKRLMAVNAKKLDEPTHQHMTTVIKQSEHLHNLINDLLEMAEIDSDSFEPQFELVEITQFLSDIKEVMTPAISEKSLALLTQFSSANLLVQTDKSRLHHVLINLLTNAIKFTDEGSITLGYKAIYFKRKLGIEIFVRDTGKGMSDDFKARMFQEFSHAEDYTESNPTNTGLGMVIVKRIIEKLGGEIQFESTRDLGSEFFIHLPLRMHKA
jgi:signal transduction histidine kinase